MGGSAFVAPTLSVSRGGLGLLGRTVCARRVSGVTVPVGHVSCARMKAADGGGESGERVGVGAGAPAKRVDAKELTARYGGAYIGTSVFLSLVSFGVLYVLIAAGFDVKGGIEAFGDWLGTTPLGRPQILDSVSEAGGTFALAYIAHKVTSPLRFPPTLVLTEIVAKAIGKDNAKKAQGE